MRNAEDRSFVVLVVAVTIAFAWIIWPYFPAVLWATVFAVIFAPLHRRLRRRLHNRPNTAAGVTLFIIVLIALVPLFGIGAALVDQAAGVYARIQSGELDFRRYFAQVLGALPPWALQSLERFGITDLAELQGRVSAALMQASKFLASQAVNVGQNMFEFVVGFFVMLYLLYFLLRDGDRLARRVREAAPLHPERKHALFEKFTVVIRATVKGNVVVAILQGVLGGVIFWLLGINAALFWAVVMAVLSLLPAVGTALVWGPVAVYLLATGAIWQGLALIAFGVLVIGLVDNVVRPILVGKDTKMPDYVVLISTLGGIALFGINGFIVGPIIAALFIAAWDLATPEAPR
jgi:predicted PurR-regulated permease PerM